MNQNKLGRLYIGAALIAVHCVSFAQTEVSDELRWALCPISDVVSNKPLASDPDHPAGTIEMRADRADLPRNGIQKFSGNVEIIQDQRALAAQSITYSDESGIADITGEASYWDKSVHWSGERGRLELNDERASLEDGDYELVGRNARGHAGSIVVNNATGIDTLADVDYSTCPNSARAWKLTASKLKLDHNRDRGSGRNVTVKFHGVPIFYSPYLSFPISNNRKSGFLSPSAGKSRDSGFDLKIPYYWNISPEQDATFTPRILGDRGVLLGGQYRYLLDAGNGQFDIEAFPNDGDFNDKARYLLNLNHQQYFLGGRGSVNIRYNQVSDKEYFEDFGSSLNVTSTRFLERRARMRYLGKYLNLSGLIQSYQTVDRSLGGVSRPYQRLPSVYFSTRIPTHSSGVNINASGEVVYFDRDESVVGGRIDLRPRISYPIIEPGYFIKPTLTLRHTQYLLGSEEGDDSNPSRTVPVLSVDTGMYLERNFSMFGDGYMQTLEPRVYYLYVPETEQDDLPLFDTGEYNFSFSQLFREDRFTGRDRVGDTNQITTALTSRIIETRTGRERFRASIGQVFFFKDRDITLPGRARETDGTSELVAEVGARFGDSWSVSGSLQYDLNDEETQKATVRMRYQPGEDTVLNVGYRLRRDVTAIGVQRDSTIEQTEMSFRWPLSTSWSAIGLWNYSLQENKTLESVGGVEYNSCCWGVRAAARRFLSTSTGEFDTTVFVQLELKGLAGFGSSARTFLERNIPGYRAEF